MLTLITAAAVLGGEPEATATVLLTVIVCDALTLAAGYAWGCL